MEYEIISVRGYFAIYINGNFYCNADTESEAEEEIKAYETEMKSV